MVDTNARFDRVGTSRRSDRQRNAHGKEALFSTAPSSAPPPPVEVRCTVCNVTTGITGLGDWWSLARPPMLFNPLQLSVWNRCPNCDTRTWLELSLGGPLRSLLGRHEH